MTKPSSPFNLVGSDIWTPSIRSLHGYEYAIGFSDYYSDYTFTTLMVKKSDAIKGLKSFHNLCTQHRFDLKGLRLDNDKVFRADDFLN